ncbi:unnamed protein product [Microthlaspi erraticum]|uniref:Uncharacterized protein n=1 Tax=Microthlaspi erraticum TaxID=1685480 RepID=A0A6D2JVU2_9BRAS|nr:unnamed protein product [Microthlaspi erraticum]
MTWHAIASNSDGKLRHPRDGLAWKAFDQKYPEFASDPRNVKLGLFGAQWGTWDVRSKEGHYAWSSTRPRMLQERKEAVCSQLDRPRLSSIELLFQESKSNPKNVASL